MRSLDPDALDGVFDVGPPTDRSATVAVEGTPRSSLLAPVERAAAGDLPRSPPRGLGLRLAGAIALVVTGLIALPWLLRAPDGAGGPAGAGEGVGGRTPEDVVDRGGGGEAATTRAGAPVADRGRGSVGAGAAGVGSGHPERSTDGAVREGLAAPRASADAEPVTGSVDARAGAGAAGVGSGHPERSTDGAVRGGLAAPPASVDAEPVIGSVDARAGAGAAGVGPGHPERSTDGAVRGELAAPRASVDAEPVTGSVDTRAGAGAAARRWEVRFGFDSATLSAALDPGGPRSCAGQVEVTGHADPTGSASYNLQLAQRRAEAVRDVLIAGGVAAARVEVRSAGERQPAVAGDALAARRASRRVVIRCVP